MNEVYLSVRGKMQEKRASAHYQDRLSRELLQETRPAEFHGANSARTASTRRGCSDATPSALIVSKDCLRLGSNTLLHDILSCIFRIHSTFTFLPPNFKKTSDTTIFEKQRRQKQETEDTNDLYYACNWLSIRPRISATHCFFLIIESSSSFTALSYKRNRS